MKIAVVSDSVYPVHRHVLAWLTAHSHEPILFGALQSGKEEPYVESACTAAQAIQKGLCEEGIFFCWTGTGISIAANKMKGIRAALCVDAQTACGARIWNHANVLALSSRLLSQDIATEILEAWFAPHDMQKGAEAATELIKLDR